MGMIKYKEISNKIRNNKILLICIIAVLISVIIVIKIKDQRIEENIVDHPDMEVEFSIKQGIIEQTWQPHIKCLSNISIPYKANSSYDAEIALMIYTDDMNEVLLKENVQYSFVKDENGQIVFDFIPIDVQIGERLRFQLQMKGEDDKGSISIPAGSKYGGCSIDGIEQNCALALKIEIIKSSYLFWIFKVLLPLIIYSLFFMVLWDKKWEEVIALSLFLVVLILYIFGIIDHLELGIKTVYVLAGILLPLSIFRICKKKINIKSLFSLGMVAWFIILGMIIINCRGIWLARSDEYTHWGLAVKDMFYFDSLAKHAETTVLLVRYMPFSTLFEYFVVYMNGMFSEALIYMAFQICLLSCISIFFVIAQKIRICIFPAIGAVIFIPLIFFYDIYNCIYVDPLLAVISVYILLCYYKDRISVFNTVRILLGIFALVLTKDMGLVLAVIICGIIFIHNIYSNFLKKKRIRVNDMMIPFIYFLAAVVIFMSWQIYLSVPGKNRNEITTIEYEYEKESKTRNTITDSGLSIEKIKRIFTGEGESYQYKSLKAFIVEMFDGETYKVGPLKLSYMDLLFGCMLVILLLKSTEKKSIILFTVMLVLGGIGYAGVLELLYMSAFSISEAMSLASHERYLGSYVCCAVIVIFYIVYESVLEKKKETNDIWRMSLYISLILIIISPISNFIYTNRDISITELEKYGYDDLEKNIRTFADKGEKFYFVCSNSKGGSLRMFQNSVSPMLVPYFEGDIGYSESNIEMQRQIYESQGITMNERAKITVEEWKERLKECNYVFLLNIDEAFILDYGEVFDYNYPVSDGNMYKVSKTGDISLKYIGNISFKTHLK